MNKVILHGFPVSPFVRSARIALIEKGVDYHFNEITLDYLATDEYAQINPFRKMPAFEQDDFILYETPAILGYVDEAFAGQSLQPNNPKARAQMHKWIAISSNYLYPIGVIQLFVQRIMYPILGVETNESVVAESVSTVAQYLDVLESEIAGAFLLGDTLNLADIIAGAMVYCINMTKEGSELVKIRPKTAAWLENLSHRESFRQTLADIIS
ncbi:glutathione S-transferase family protein [Calothrix sp. PCC 7507]|uniref:glutathione S-transferase family protein n=1 Tax=Calothrix sp. PCC 7507 TaxID=99598 RepID=UPI00029EC8C6|nr:glutathione S-transferase family protein [Calothrix sp. PCC 7507]AFY32175.1 Glutathione S-transferase domain protein [Calothrix sp. PCC 7507]